MDNRPIGVFDSGLGGLTAVCEIKKIMPHEDIIYFGDTGRLPYGTKSEQTIIKYTKDDINFLKSYNIKTIVIACGTASSVALDIVRDDYDLNIVGVVLPTVNSAINYTKGQKIGIIATSSTIKSGSYERMIKEISDNNDLDIQIFTKACPLFVPLVENGRFLKNDKVTPIIISEYLEEFKQAEIDTLIMGCTHYPLLSDLISEYLGENVKLIDPGKETALYLDKTLEKCSPKNGNDLYFVSDDVDNFCKNAKIFLGKEVSAKLINIENE